MKDKIRAIYWMLKSELREILNENDSRDIDTVNRVLMSATHKILLDTLERKYSVNPSEAQEEEYRDALKEQVDFWNELYKERTGMD